MTDWLSPSVFAQQLIFAPHLNQPRLPLHRVNTSFRFFTAYPDFAAGVIYASIISVLVLLAIGEGFFRHQSYLRFVVFYRVLS